MNVSKITIALTGGYYPGDEEAMENPRGVSSSLPGHMCTVVFFINITIITINLSIKSPFSYREDS